MQQIKKMFFILLLLFINSISAQCWFKELLIETNSNAKLSAYFKNASKEEFNAYKTLQTNGSKYIKTNPTYIEKFSKLSPENQAKIALFNDDKVGSTLTKFLDDCDTDFLIYINNPENLIQVKGFLAHKTGMLSTEESEKLAEMLRRLDEIPSDKARKWLDYGANQAVFKTNREAGTAFGNLIKTQLSDANSEAYTTLAKHLNDLNPKINLDEYSIYSQVQLCLTKNCIDKGQFWIPDFMLVKVSQDGLGKDFLETIIIDSKLSGSTGWTPNQNTAKKMDGWSIKAIGNEALIKGSRIEDFDVKSSITKNGDFIKLYSESGILKTK
ncbi:hypothetical protein [Flavobacterium crassostreae]|uniref:Uncharacterized protein n=1 Tax=Flavobacterium crassostreae TaxID=1763534 RepID=A0A1B9DXI9_9FLAO|nr:hypothetical protein [Flavobacterium crassostreae]OCB74411.1 hypothetical protein LPBF_10465 [Flavobacterium crassostreae]